MPQGHLPVRSYLAVPVVSRSGEVLGGLFFGHPEPGVFGERAERIVAAIAVQAAIAIDKARLYRAAQDEIERRRKDRGGPARKRAGPRAQDRRAHGRACCDECQAAGRSEEREQAEGSFQLLVEGVTDYAIYMLDPSGIVSNWNTGAQRIKGYTAERDRRPALQPLLHRGGPHGGRCPSGRSRMARDSGKFEAEGWRVRKDGTRFWASVVINRDPRHAAAS